MLLLKKYTWQILGGAPRLWSASASSVSMELYMFDLLQKREHVKNKSGIFYFIL
jgi:hypothetical protein